MMMDSLSWFVLKLPVNGASDAMKAVMLSIVYPTFTTVVKLPPNVS